MLSDNDKEIKDLKRRMLEVETQIAEICTLSPTYAMTQQLEEIMEKVDKVLGENDFLRNQIGKNIDEKVNKKSDFKPNEIRTEWEKSKIPIQDLSRKFSVSVSYMQTLIDGESDNVSLKKRLLTFLLKKKLVM